jgi:hypothetical protein
MEKLSSPLYRLLYKIAGDRYKDFIKVLLAWSSVVGDIMANKSTIVRFENKVLFVKVINHVWMSEFVLNKTLFIQRIKEQTNITLENIVYSI